MRTQSDVSADTQAFLQWLEAFDRRAAELTARQEVLLRGRVDHPCATGRSPEPHSNRADQMALRDIALLWRRSRADYQPAPRAFPMGSKAFLLALVAAFLGAIGPVRAATVTLQFRA